MTSYKGLHYEEPDADEGLQKGKNRRRTIGSGTFGIRGKLENESISSIMGDSDQDCTFHKYAFIPRITSPVGEVKNELSKSLPSFLSMFR